MVNALGDLGGVAQIAAFLLSIIFYPIAHHSFVLKALERLYLASTSDANLFSRTFDTAKIYKRKHFKNKYLTYKKDMPPIFKDTKVEKEIRNHYPIKISLWNSIKLFFIRPCRCNNYKWLKNNGKVT